jgi:hypothetical protein
MRSVGLGGPALEGAWYSAASLSSVVPFSLRSTTRRPPRLSRKVARSTSGGTTVSCGWAWTNGTPPRSAASDQARVTDKYYQWCQEAGWQPTPDQIVYRGSIYLAVTDQQAEAWLEGVKRAGPVPGPAAAAGLPFGRPALPPSCSAVAVYHATDGGPNRKVPRHMRKPDTIRGCPGSSPGSTLCVVSRVASAIRDLLSAC